MGDGQRELDYRVITAHIKAGGGCPCGRGHCEDEIRDDASVGVHEAEATMSNGHIGDEH